MSGAGQIRKVEPIQASAIVMEAARSNCAANLRENGHEAEAVMFETGKRDFAWRMRHEVARLLGEAASAPQ